MNTFSKFIQSVAIVALTVLVFASCKKTYDTPPVQTDPNIVANTTLKSLKAMHTGSGSFDAITTDIVISGTVIADDRSGNLYKTIYIADSTGALQVNLDESYVYGTFPVGRKVFIKCNGLTLSDYHGTPELGVKVTVAGLPSLLGIPAPLIGNYVIGGSLNNPVVPKVVTVSQLTTSMQDPNLGNLIELDGFEFQPGDTSKTYADTSQYKSSVDLYIHNCTSPSTLLDVRSSGYANFAGLKPAKGNGTIYAIYTVYGTTKQLIIRDTSDVKFYGTRCNGSGGSGGGTGGGGAITMAQLRALYTGSSVTVPSGDQITAKVISNNSNEANGNYRLEDASGAGVIFFSAVGSPVYPLGTVLTINAGGGTLNPYNGDLELSQVPASAVSVSGTSITLATPVYTIAQIIANNQNLASTQVKINNITAITQTSTSGTGTNYNVTDGTGTIVLFVRTASGITVNTAAHSITGYVSLFNTTTQIGIRSASDLQ